MSAGYKRFGVAFLWRRCFLPRSGAPGTLGVTSGSPGLSPLGATTPRGEIRSPSVAVGKSLSHAGRGQQTFLLLLPPALRGRKGVFCVFPGDLEAPGAAAAGITTTHPRCVKIPPRIPLKDSQGLSLVARCGHRSEWVPAGQGETEQHGLDEDGRCREKTSAALVKRCVFVCSVFHSLVLLSYSLLNLTCCF